MKKWDARYFVLTTARLYYFKTMEDFKEGNGQPSGIIQIKDHVIEATPSNCEFVLRGADRTYRFKADDEGMAHRWITALRAVQVSSMAEWSARELIAFGRMVGFPGEALLFFHEKNIDGNLFARLKSPSHLTAKGYTGRSDTIWMMLNNLMTPAVHDWLARFSAFCKNNASERQLENAEMLCLIRLGKGLEVMNSRNTPEETTPIQPPPPQQQPQYEWMISPQDTPERVAMAPASTTVYIDEDDDGLVPDDV
jgi:hypothetical protein